ncbi:hypothetical protein Q5O14_17745 [Eubacteriaceae bacterium ES2]|nr:hypothetical protein Q5O14_17745 [Eubacteriaceae bacterium ES2]
MISLYFELLFLGFGIIAFIGTINYKSKHPECNSYFKAFFAFVKELTKNVLEGDFELDKSLNYEFSLTGPEEAKVMIGKIECYKSPVLKNSKMDNSKGVYQFFLASKGLKNEYLEMSKLDLYKSIKHDIKYYFNIEVFVVDIPVHIIRMTSTTMIFEIPFSNFGWKYISEKEISKDEIIYQNSNSLDDDANNRKMEEEIE